ncbi:MAG: hypothetical protein A3F16_00965 [Deltaproteobacteria bacterium RIFCSPHIGHO2_12_FULL_43_9]|nr:MAG: hypothetical protein A3F16_00965 [Deltaproteobacteria bacterium RIFCSPHIGHO2_12_FULL_43_9]
MKKSKWLQSAILARYSGILHGFSTSLIGDASSAEQSVLLSCSLGVKKNQLQLMSQQHGCDIKIINDVERPLPRVDALITNVRGVALGVRTADCVPILIYDPQNRVIAAVHAGWRGGAEHVAGKTVDLMKHSFNTKAPDCIVAIGPAIGECCFEVGQEVIDKFPSSSVAGGTHLDLPAAIVTELTDTGIKRDNIDWLNICTSCEKGLCFSHRRDKGMTGRHLAMIMMCDI